MLHKILSQLKIITHVMSLEKNSGPVFAISHQAIFSIFVISLHLVSSHIKLCLEGFFKLRRNEGKILIYSTPF